MLQYALKGSDRYYMWMGGLALLVGIGLYNWYVQVTEGFIVTNLSDQVSWGAYIANFTFLVGVAAAAVLLVVPAYVMHREDVKKVVLLGELLAVSAIVMCLGFVTVDLGHPERALHLLRLNVPSSMLAWDVLVLNGYLFLNLHIPGYLLWKKYCGESPVKNRYLPLVFVSMFWAVSIHTVTAFLYSGLGARPFWNSAVLAPRFLISAFAAGPPILIIVLAAIRHFGKYDVADSVFKMLITVVKVTLPINLFLFGSELFTELYTGSHHAISVHYMFMGHEGGSMLVPYTWASLGLSLFGLLVFYSKDILQKPALLFSACGALVVGIWIEKGMGLLIPGFFPTPLGDLIEYIPSWTEFWVSIGIWSLGIFVYTGMARVALAILKGELKDESLVVPEDDSDISADVEVES
ncbi:MAG: polysulfide reductase NrfD [Deltaproteobacteria bacterium]|nr:polysulfide reductase NrfD [Deltaproteobacteria bacterium]